MKKIDYFYVKGDKTMTVKILQNYVSKFTKIKKILKKNLNIKTKVKFKRIKSIRI